MGAIDSCIDGCGDGHNSSGSNPSRREPEHMSDSPARRVKRARSEVSDEWSATDSNDVPSPAKKKAQMGKNRDYNEWPAQTTDVLLDILVEIRERNPRASWNYADIANEVMKRTTHRYPPDVVKSKIGRMRTDFTTFDKLMKDTGLGFDPDLGVPTCDDETFKRYKAQNPTAGKFKLAPLHRADDYFKVFAPSTATGRISQSSGVPIGGAGSSRRSDDPDPTIPHIAVPRIPPRTRDGDMENQGTSKKSRSTKLDSVDTAAKTITAFNTKMIERMETSSYSAGKPSELRRALDILGKMRKLVTYRKYNEACNRLTCAETREIFVHHKKKDRYKWLKETQVPPPTGESSTDSEYDPDATLSDISDD